MHTAALYVVQAVVHRHLLTFVCILLSLTLLLLIVVLWNRRKLLKSLERAARVTSHVVEISSYRDSLHQFHREMSRARRYQHALTVAVVDVAVSRAIENHLGVLAPSMVRESSELQELLVKSPLIACLLRDSVRASDVVSYDGSRDRYIVALPQVNKAQAAQFVRRMHELARERAIGSLSVGLAEFPSDALVLDDLVDMAELACRVRYETAAAGVRANPIDISND